MLRRKSCWYHALIKSIGSTPLGARVFAFLLHHFDKRLFQWSGGRTTVASFMAGLPVVMVTTTGAKTGFPRTLPLLSIPDPQNANHFAIIASNWGQQKYPAWYFNLKADPRAICSVVGQTTSTEYVAHEATDESEYNRIWQHAASIYGGYTQYRKRVGNRHIPIMVLQPVNSAQ